MNVIGTKKTSNLLIEMFNNNKLNVMKNLDIMKLDKKQMNLE